MLAEAITINRELHSGELVTWQGDYFRIDSARIWDVPDGPSRSIGRIPIWWGPDRNAAAGFTDVALVQVGDENQQRFLDEAAGPLLEKLRA